MENDSFETKDEEIKGRGLINEIFSWSLSDVLNKNLYNSQVKEIPMTFSSIDHFMNSFKLPLIEETHVDLLSNMTRVSCAPVRQVWSLGLSEFYKPDKDLLFAISLEDLSESESEESETEPDKDDSKKGNYESIYKPEIGDLIALTNVRPNCIDDLNRPEWPYIIAYVCSLWDDEPGQIRILSQKALSLFSFEIERDKEGVEEDDHTSKLEDGQPLDEKEVEEDGRPLDEEEVEEDGRPLDEKGAGEDDQLRKLEDGQQLFAVYLTNLTTNIRIWQALNSELQWNNYDIIRQVLATKSSVNESCSLCNNTEICGAIETSLRETLCKFKLNDSQKAAVLSCIAAKDCLHRNTVKLIWGPPGTGKTKTVSSLLFILLKMKCRTLTCTPTNIAVLGVAQRLMSLVKDSLECDNYGLGDIVLFGNKKRMKIKDRDYLHNVFLDNRVRSLSSCLCSRSGWKQSLEFMICLLEDSEGLYNLYLRIQKEDRLRRKREAERLRKKQEEERRRKEEEEDRRRNARNSVASDDQKDENPNKGYDFSLKLERLRLRRKREAERLRKKQEEERRRKEEEEDRRRNTRNSVACDDQKDENPKKGYDFSLKLEKLGGKQDEKYHSRIKSNNKVDDFQYQEDEYSEIGDSVEIIEDESDDEDNKSIKRRVVQNIIDIAKDTKKKENTKKEKAEKKKKGGKVKKKMSSNGDGKYNDFKIIEKKNEEVEEVKDEDLTFEEFVSEGFNIFRRGLMNCIPILCTHLPTSFISLEVAKEMTKVLFLLDAEDSINGMNYFNTLRVGGECIQILRNLRDTFSIPEIGMEGIKGFCLQNSCLVFCTASSSVQMHTKEMKPLELLVIDEAALLKECESTIPLQLPGLRHAILVGDEKQLPAMVQSKISENAEFGRSLFERLVILRHQKHLLNVQYRMHPSISQFPNKHFYDNKILDGPNVKERNYERCFLNGGMYGPYSFIDLSHGKEEFDKKNSTRNMMEVAVISDIIERLFKECVLKNQKVSVGCISPYKAQVFAIQQKLGKKYERQSNFSVSVRSVDGFQGGEEDIIIISTVRCNLNGSVGFLSNHNRTNVALTRARYCLWIVGSGSTLAKSRSVWKELVLDAKARGCFYKANEDKNLALAIVDALTESCQLDSIFSMDCLLFKESKWKVCFNDEFLKSVSRPKDAEIRKKVISLLVKLSSGWRLPQGNGIVDDKEIDETCAQLLEIYSVDRNLYLLWTVEILMENSVCMQVIKVWYIAPFFKIKELTKNLGRVFGNYTVDRMNRCKIRNVEENLVVPMKWPMNPDEGDTSWRSLSSQLSRMGLQNEPRSFGSSFRHDWKSNKYRGKYYETRQGGW